MVSASERIFFGGYASGLDTNALIDALISIQRRPILMAQARRIEIDQRKSALATIGSSLTNLLARLADLRDPMIAGGRTASTDQLTSDPTKLGVSVSSSAAVGEFTVDIVSLATPTKVLSPSAVGQAVDQAQPLDAAGLSITLVAGTFTINNTEFTIAGGTASTAESASAAGSGVSLTATLDSAGLTIAPAASGAFTINSIQISYDATVDSLNDIIVRINSSSAAVTATFDSETDTLLLTADSNGPTAITYADSTGNFMEAMNFVDAVAAPIATEIAGTDIVSLSSVVQTINDAAIGVTASIVNDSDSRANLLQLTSASSISLGSGGDSSNFLAAMHLLASPAGSTRVSVRNLGVLSPTVSLDEARMQTAFSESAGSFKINDVTISYDTTVDSLNNVISRINQSSAGVTAAYDTQTDTLVITSDSTGSLALALEDTTGNFLAAFGVLNATQTNGQNASYRIDGGALRYATGNVVTDAVTGVNLTFKDETSSAITVTIGADVTRLRSKLGAFVEQYNSTMSQIAGATKYEEDGDNGVLFGDATLRNLERSLRSLVTGRATGMNGDLSTLSDIGLTFGTVGSAVGSTGLLIFTTATFNAAMLDDTDGVAQLLSGFSAGAALEAGGAGSLASISGTPTLVKDSGEYTFAMVEGTGALTMSFQSDDGSSLVVTNVTISPGEVNTTLIPGLALTFADPLVSGNDTVTITAVEEGIAKTLHEYVNTYAASGGLMDSRATEMQARIDDINEQVALMETRVEARRERLIRKFAQLEVTMQRLQNQQAALTTLVNQWNANRRSS